MGVRIDVDLAPQTQASPLADLGGHNFCIDLRYFLYGLAGVSVSKRGNTTTLWESLQQGEQMKARGIPLGLFLTTVKENKRPRFKSPKKKRGK